jgi:hypothetical protein
MAAGVALKVANLGSLVRSAQAPRFSEGSMSQEERLRHFDDPKSALASYYIAKRMDRIAHDP